jgi:ubiquinone/menaquinone biosynthesis C-methylase UbiE
VQLQEGRAERLPCGDDSVDLVLSSMTLQHIPDVPAVLSEVNRVLRADGRFVGIEPNNLSNEFYFDGPLEEVNAAFRLLFAAQREAGRPADGVRSIDARLGIPATPLASRFGSGWKRSLAG